jgi:DNA polymerase III epsilon subunit-like protein
MSRPHEAYTLVIDTETTGLPPRYAPPGASSAWDKCRMVQVAWELYDAEGNHITSECHLIRPDGYVIPLESTRIHGIRHDHATEHGAPFARVMERLMDVLPSVKRIVAHNMSFDDGVIQSELHRALAAGSVRMGHVLDLWNTKEKVCTMKTTTQPGQKWPKLTELYQTCFGKQPSGDMHRADADVRACAEIYHHLVKERII